MVFLLLKAEGKKKKKEKEQDKTSPRARLLCMGRHALWTRPHRVTDRVARQDGLMGQEQVAPIAEGLAGEFQSSSLHKLV